VILCTVYTMHKEMMSAGFFIEPQNQGLWFISGLTSKPVAPSLSVDEDDVGHGSRSSSLLYLETS
jgi:hypothetical protein